MSNLSEPADLDPSNPIYFAPRSLRERARSGNISSKLPKDNSLPPFSFEASLMEAIEKSNRSPFDPELGNDRPGYGKRPGQRTVAWWWIAAIGGLALLALTLVNVMLFLGDRAQQSNASSLPRLPKTELTKAPREDPSRPALAEFSKSPAIDLTTPQPHPAMTHEQSEALLHRFLQWQQNLDSTAHAVR
jgi:hypothetical protein